MAKPATITDDDVRRIASTLVASGVEPTVKLVRQIHGSASDSTIAPLLKAWRNERCLDVHTRGSVSKKLLDAINEEISAACVETSTELRKELSTLNDMQVELMADSKRKQNRIEELEASLEHLSREQSKNASIIESLRLTFSDQQDKHLASIDDLRRRLAEAVQGRQAAELATAVLQTKLELLAFPSQHPSAIKHEL